MELLVPIVSDVVFKYTWPIPNYKRTISKKSHIDSPPFNVNINGIHSTWNLSIRFWKNPDVFNADVKHWEYCHVSRTILELKSYTDIISLGYRDLSIVHRHLKKNGEVVLMVKIQIIQYESEKHNLSQDMARLLKHSYGADTKLICGGLNNTEIPVHSTVLTARSNVLAEMILPLKEFNERKDMKTNTIKDKMDTRMLQENNIIDKESGRFNNFYSSLFFLRKRYVFSLELLDLSKEVAEEFLRYIYSDQVDNLDNFAPQLLSLAERFSLQGLKELCERNLIETITPENIASRLLIADEFGCDALKKASLAYCEENLTVLNKSLAWKIMEQTNPELFNEVCEAGIGSSRSSNMDDSELSN
ncbi:protein roadkill isoform X5 [Apis mellifera]|uniref:Protein roadkill isoform X5 n=1 Tax=Apis mellifera TaxID=7460 RepID=A0A7M7IJF9_APIME|nr:protein roadkill isoform X5 [Apis mellifera]|eukprot:XP_016770909.1 protein roadkill isoform X5 [Apis mellifera]